MRKRSYVITFSSLCGPWKATLGFLTFGLWIECDLFFFFFNYTVRRYHRVMRARCRAVCLSHHRCVICRLRGCAQSAHVLSRRPIASSSQMLPSRIAGPSTFSLWWNYLPKRQSKQFLLKLRAFCTSHSDSDDMSSEQDQIINNDEMHNFIVRCMLKAGTKKEHALALADLLVAADYRGHYSHGLNRLDMYVRDVKSGMTASDKEPEVVKETVATALVDGQNLLGPVVGKTCIDLAIEKAKNVGIGLVAARNSNHFGIAGWYSMRAMDQGLIGMAFTNTSPLMVPTRGTKATLGTNPISFAAPADKGDSFVLDMATTAVALGKLELNERKGIDIPLGWGCDQNGKPTTDPSQASALMPLGGTEECSGYKGYGLAAMVEILCGILAGANYGPNIRRWKTTDRVANLGQCFLAINPTMFGDGFTGRMTDLNSSLRNLPPAEGEEEVLVPGDPELAHQKLCDKQGGIPYHANQVKYAMDLASQLSVDPPKVLS